MTVPRPPRRTACLVIACLLAPRAARADDEVVRVSAAADAPVVARVRRELEALGHAVRFVAGDAPTDAPPGLAGDVRVEPRTAELLVAHVRMRDRPETTVAVDAREPEHEGLFALRVAEAVRAGLLPVAAAPAVATVVPAPRALEWSAGLGVRALWSPGGVGAVALPMARARWSRRAYAELSLAAPSLGGATDAGLSLDVWQATLGAGVALARLRTVRLDAGARFEAARVAVRTDAQQTRDLTFAASAVASARWTPHPRVGLWVGLSGGALLRPVVLRIGDATVAEWGPALLGTEFGIEALF